MDELKIKKELLMTTFKTILCSIRAHGIADADIGRYNSVWFVYKTMASFLLKTANQTKYETQVICFIHSNILDIY